MDSLKGFEELRMDEMMSVSGGDSASAKTTVGGVGAVALGAIVIAISGPVGIALIAAGSIAAVTGGYITAKDMKK